MLCSGCGMDIPFAGQVCPHCQRDKVVEQKWILKAQLVAFMFIIPGAILGGLINGFLGAFIGIIVSLLACIIYLVFTTTPPPVAGPPEVHVSNPQGESSANNPSVEQKLISLAELKEKGLITDDEFSNAKKNIIANL